MWHMTAFPQLAGTWTSRVGCVCGELVCCFCSAPPSLRTVRRKRRTKGGKLRLRFVGSDLVPVVSSPSVLFNVVLFSSSSRLHVPRLLLCLVPQTNVSLSFMSFQSFMCFSFFFLDRSPTRRRCVSVTDSEFTISTLQSVCCCLRRILLTLFLYFYFLSENISTT